MDTQVGTLPTAAGRYPMPYPGIVSYVNQRNGRMTAGQQRLWDADGARLGRAVSELPPGSLDFTAWFEREAPVVLEVGSGSGEATALLAAAQPEVNYLVVELYKPGLAQLMLRADKLGARNLRLLHGDAVAALSEHISNEALHEIRVFFPDPWLKLKHRKRRLIQPAFVSLAASKLRAGGLLHLSSDWPDYADQMMAVCTAEPMLRNTYPDEPLGWAPRPSWRPMTKFERQAQDSDRVNRDLIFQRVS